MVVTVVTVFSPSCITCQVRHSLLLFENTIISQIINSQLTTRLKDPKAENCFLSAAMERTLHRVHTPVIVWSLNKK